MSYRVILTEGAERDLDELFDYLLEREVRSPTGDPDVAMRAMLAIRASIDTLRRIPFTCRRAGTSPFLRELVISFGHSGYVALFEILDSKTVEVLAVRHQREGDYH